MKRREFVQNTTLAGVGLSILPQTKTNEKKALDKIKVAVIGTGLRGQNHVNNLVNRDDCELVAIADISDRMVESTLKLVDKAGRPKPTVYKDGPLDYLRLLEKEKLDAAVIATPWRWHTPMAVACMEAGVYVGTEVCGGFSLDECWQLVNTHERTGTHLYFLENVCFRRDVMAILTMVRKGMFGELIHLEGGYQHDLRGVKFNDGQSPYNSGVEFGEKAFSEAKWRTQHSVHRDGDLYPTHGLGPLMTYTNINRGNRLIYLTSMSTKARGLKDYVAHHPKGGPNHPNANKEYKLGDVVTTLIQTANGEKMLLSHDTNLPRPYSLGFRVQGTKGLWMDVNRSLHIEGVTEPHQWEDAESYYDKYENPVWTKNKAAAEGSGHGGMDWFMTNSFVNCVKEQKEAAIDVYDAATMLCITPLSEQSIAEGSTPQAIPDFTRGRWMDREPFEL